MENKLIRNAIRTLEQITETWTHPSIPNTHCLAAISSLQEMLNVKKHEQECAEIGKQNENSS